MALKPNVTMTYASAELLDDGVRLHFVAADPGPAQPSEYSVFFTYDELDGINNDNALRNQVDLRLRRKLRNDDVTAQLLALINHTVQI